MNLVELKESLRPWMTAVTWHTKHPEDQRRFHTGLKAAFDKLGVDIRHDEFRDAIRELADECHPNIATLLRDEAADQFARDATQIAGYLRDVA